MARIKFKVGEQRIFIDEVLKKINCPSLRSLNQYGFEIPYSTLRNYYSEARTLPEEFFKSLCHISKINPNSINFEKTSENWGQSLGGFNRNLKKKKN